MQVMSINRPDNKQTFGMRFSNQATRGIHESLAVLETDTLELLETLKTQKSDGCTLEKFVPKGKFDKIKKIFVEIIDKNGDPKIQKSLKLNEINEVLRPILSSTNQEADRLKRKSLIRILMSE